MKRIVVVGICVIVVTALGFSAPVAAETWGQKLGWGPNDRVLIIHADDVAMCHETTLAATEAYRNGVVSSMSIEMPCPWVGEMAAYLKQHPDTDAGLHLAFTSEWANYRWPPVAGKCAVPGLVDPTGCMWDDVEPVVQHATPDEIETEMRAQIARAAAFGIKPTHLDTHMGTLFASPAYFERYVKVGIEMGVPILAIDLQPERLQGEARARAEMMRPMVQKIWDAGLPVIDRMLPTAYETTPAQKKAEYIRLLHELKPGVSQLIVHCGKDTITFRAITHSADRWIADGTVMLDPDLKRVIKEEGIILTSWRELKARRDAAGK